MKIEKLKAGMEIKNYRELCNILELDIKTGGAKKNQLDWIQDYVKYKQKGHRFMILDVYNDIEIVPMRGRGGDMSDNTHIEYIEKLILDLLVQDKSDGEIFLSKSKIFETLDMVNVNFGSSKRQSQKVALFSDIHQLNADEWFSSTGGMLERNLNKALNRLENQYLIFWSKKLTIHKSSTVAAGKVTGDENVVINPKEAQNREASKEEVQIIIKTEREVMREIGCDNKQMIIAKKKWNLFQRMVKEVLYEEQGIDYYWQSYHIVYNPAHVKEGADELNKRLLPYKDRTAYKKLLNLAIQDNSNTNSENRSKLSMKRLQEFNARDREKDERRAKDSYISDSVKLSKTMIDKSTGDLRYEISKQKVEKKEI